MIAFKTEGDTEFTRLLLGDDTATGGDMYAMTSNDPRVFLVAAYLDTSFDRGTFDLRDKAILDFDTDEVDRIDITAPSHTVALVKTDEAWRVEQPWSARGDAGITNALVTRLVTGRMQAIVATDTTALDAFGLEAPRLTAVVGTGSTRATLWVGDATDDGTVYARDAAPTASLHRRRIARRRADAAPGCLSPEGSVHLPVVQCDAARDRSARLDARAREVGRRPAGVATAGAGAW